MDKLPRSGSGLFQSSRIAGSGKLIRHGYSSAFPCDSSWTRGASVCWCRGVERVSSRSAFSYSFTPTLMTSSQSPQRNTSPAFHALHINKDGFSTKIGAAWPSKSGKAINLVLDFIPLDGRICLVKPKSKADA